MIAEILPPAVRSSEAFDDLQPSPLFAEEEAVLAGAVDKRRREFATTRMCARRAMVDLGFAPVAVLPGAGRAPQWPVGVVGSMTHCDGYRAAALARAADIATIGIDAEPHQPLPGDVAHLVMSRAEEDALARMGRDDPLVCWDRLLFCAKEAVYKAWYPLAGTWLDFLEAEVDIQRDGTFAVRLLVVPPPRAALLTTGFGGRWLARDGLLLAAIALTAPD